jgi:ATP-dependent DNA helicase RecQ
MMKTLGLVRELRGSRFRLLQAEVPADRIEAVAAEYAGRQDADREKLERMAAYAQSAQCRWKLLLDYFGEVENVERCGTCDNCLEPLDVRLGATPPTSTFVAPTGKPAA